MDDASLLSVTADATLAQLRRAYMKRMAEWASASSAGGGNSQLGESHAPESITHAYVRMRDRALEREHELTRHSLTDAHALPPEASEQGRRDAVFEALERRDFSGAERLLDAMEADGQLRWERLREEPAPGRAAWLFAHFGERELLSGRGRALATLLASAEFSTDISRVPELLRHAHRLASFTVLENSEDTERFLKAHPDPARPSTRWPKVRRTIASCSKAWEALELPRAALSALWSSPLAFKPSPELEDMVLRVFADDHRAVPRLDALRAGARPLFGHLMLAAQTWAPRDDRVWQELTAAEQGELRTLVLEMERVAARDPYRRCLHYLPHAALVLVLGAFAIFGVVYGILALVAAFVGVLTVWMKGAAFVYRRALRPLLTPHVIGKGMPPDRVIEAAWHVGSEPRGKNKIAEDYFANFVYDHVLDTVGALRRLHQARGRGAPAKLRLASLYVPPGHRITSELGE